MSKKPKRKSEALGNIGNLIKVRLPFDIQQQLGCIVGVNVTGENPCYEVNKYSLLTVLEDIVVNIVLKKIAHNEDDEILLIYNPKHSNEDVFFICTTSESRVEAMLALEKIKEEQKDRVVKQCYRNIRPWVSLGSEVEIIEEIQRNRPMYEVEIQARYPIMKSYCKFYYRMVGDCRDGYAEILERKPLPILSRKKCDVAVQVKNVTVDNMEQVGFRLTINATTQCFDDCLPQVHIDDAINVNMPENVLDCVYEKIYFGSSVDLYSQDYLDLVLNEDAVKIVREIKPPIIFQFLGANIRKGTQVTSVDWSPMTAGFVVVAYGARSLNNVLPKGQSRFDNPLTPNPVLIWSLNDELLPRLTLESHGDVTSITFCPYDDEIIVGGCNTGHVTIWDIRHPLEYFESLIDKKRSSSRLISMQKEMIDESFIPFTILNDIAHGHTSLITHVQFLPPYQKMERNGKVVVSSEYSYQFFTASLDGLICFWDITVNHETPTISSRDHKRQRKPSSIAKHISPLRSLHRILKPFYKIALANPKIPIMSLSVPLYNLKYNAVYKRMDQDDELKSKIYQQIDKKVVKLQTRFFAGTMYGEVLSGKWEGCDASQYVYEEQAKINGISKYHDGPVNLILRWPAQDNIILTVGGKVFCIWKEDNLEHPIIWRKGCVRYTHATFLFDLRAFLVLRVDGAYEVWYPSRLSHRYTVIEHVDANILTGIYIYRSFDFMRISCIGDNNGSLRIVDHRILSNLKSQYDKEFLTFLEHQQYIMNKFYAFQNAFTEKLEQKEREAEEARQKEMGRLRDIRMKSELHRVRIEYERERLRKEMRQSHSRTSLADAMQQSNEDAVKKTLITSGLKRLFEIRQLNPQKLKEQYEPLRVLEEEEGKKRKQVNHMNAQSSKIFNNHLAMYIPQLLEKKVIPKRSPYERKPSDAEKIAIIQHYAEQIPIIEEYIADHPFQYTFNWNEITNRKRRKYERRIPKLPEMLDEEVESKYSYNSQKNYRSETSDISEKSYKSQKSNKSGRSHKSHKSLRSHKSNRSIKSEKSLKSVKSTKSHKREKVKREKL